MAVPRQPKIALSCATVAPASAARVAAILRQPCADLFTPAARHASFENVAKRFLGQRLTALTTNECQFAGWAGIERLLEDRQDWNADDHFALAFLSA